MDFDKVACGDDPCLVLEIVQAIVSLAWVVERRFWTKRKMGFRDRVWVIKFALPD